jgi:hypothetical protein
LSFLRCESCGAKALPIATRCPSCATPFFHGEPGSGRELKALRPCVKCDSLLPHGTTPCPWCGELKAHRFPILRVALLSLAGVGFVSAIFTVLVQEGKLSFGDGDKVQPALAVSEAQAERADPPFVPETAAVAVVNLEPEVAAAPDPVPATDVPEAAPSVASPPPAPTTPPQRFTRVEPETQEEIRWVRTVAGNFANVRAAGSSQAPILGMISPGDSLELEDTARGWRRVRAGRVAGWVWAPVLNLPSGL